MRRSVLAVLLTLFVAGCSKKATGLQITNLVIVAPENLSGDESLNWIADAIPALLSLQLEGLPNLSIHRIAHARDAVGKSITRVYCRYTSRDLDCWKEGEGTGIHASGSLAQGLPAIVNTVAKSLDGNSKPTPSISNAALKAYAEKNFEEAVRLDPDFGLAYTDGASALVAAGDRERATKLVEAGLARKTAIPELQQAQLAFVKASLTGNRDGQIAALERMTTLDRNDVVQLRTYAQYLRAARKLPEAAAAQGALAALLPDDPDVWNTLGYSRAYVGDLAGAKGALDKYRELVPNSANALDSLGEVYFYLGKFSEAEKYFIDAYDKQPQFNGGEAMYKAAIARFRTGDRAGAKQLFDKFAANLKVSREWLEIRWEYLTGNREKAESAAKEYAAKNNNAIAWGHVAMWALVRGDSTTAGIASREALKLAKTPEERTELAGVALIFRALESGDQSVPLANAWALLLRKQPAAAEPVLQQLFNSTSVQNDRQPRLLLAWAESESGKKEAVQELMKFNTVPPSAVTNPLESVLFVKEFELKR